MALPLIPILLGVAAIAALTSAGGGGSSSSQSPTIGPDPTQWRILNPWEYTSLEQAQLAAYKPGGIQALASGKYADVIIGGKWRRFQNSGVQNDVTIWAPAGEPLNGSPPGTGVVTPKNTVPQGPANPQGMVTPSTGPSNLPTDQTTQPKSGTVMGNGSLGGASGSADAGDQNGSDVSDIGDMGDGGDDSADDASVN